MEEAFLSGRDQGIKEIVTALFEETENCNVVPIFMENSSKKLVDRDCLEFENNPNP